MTRTILTTASGRQVDLLNPAPADIDFGDIAEHLAKENRYNGATPGRAYSVAEHLVRGTLAIHAEAARLLGPAQADAAAAWFALHDCHEAYLRDDTTPKKRALEAVAVQHFGVLAGAITGAYGALTERFDRAIAEAAGLPWPAPGRIGDLVHLYDQRMLATEWRDLMTGPPPFPAYEPLETEIVPWRWDYARDALAHIFRRFLPALKAAPDQTRGEWAFPDGTPVKDGARD